jgi:CRP/FNR family cyclic AMP-dependent transcriptional regulator
MLRWHPTDAIKRQRSYSPERATMIVTNCSKPSLFFERFMSYLLARSSRVKEDLIDQLFNSSDKCLGPTVPSLQLSASTVGRSR